MQDDPALQALAAAVAAADDDLELRLLYARRLLVGGDAATALEQASTVLHAAPAHLDGLRLAAEAASADGRADAAVGYRRLLAALGGDDVSTASTGHDGDPDAGVSPPPPIPSPFGAAGGDLAHTDTPLPDELRSDPSAGPPPPPRPDPVTLADVGGMAEVKRRLEATFLGPMRSPQLRAAFGTSLRGGLLLYGPPGCGKTFLARALAGELHAGFVSIALTDVLDPYLGVSERLLHERFEQARRAAPCVLFIDEVDALGQKRSNLRGSAARTLVNQLLLELDSADHDRDDGVFVLGATNHPWDVDAALRRPGRFDRTLLVLPPDVAARQVILEHHLRSRPTSAVDTAELAKRSDGYSGADLAHACETAAQAALARSSALGSVSPITTEDLGRAIGDIRPSTAAWLELARNHVLYANEDGQYDELAAYLQQRRR